MKSLRPYIDKGKILFKEYRLRKYYSIAHKKTIAGNLIEYINSPGNTIADTWDPIFVTETSSCNCYIKNSSTYSTCVIEHMYIIIKGTPHLCIISLINI